MDKKEHPCLSGDPRAASLILSAGRGLKTALCFDKMLHLADALSGQAVGTRAAVDLGWIPPSREVGLSGLRLSPRLCLSFGVSGANFHTMGMYRAEFVLSVNPDRKARIFRLSDYCVYAEAEPVLDTLLKALPEGGLSEAEEIREFLLRKLQGYPCESHSLRIND